MRGAAPKSIKGAEGVLIGHAEKGLRAFGRRYVLRGKLIYLFFISRVPRGVCRF